MSAQPVEPGFPRDHAGSGDDADTVLVHAPDEVEVRRNAAVSAVVGVAASAIAIAYLWRAAGTGAVLDWTLCVVLAGLAVTFFHGLLDARLPLLVADEMGVRVRLGSQWRGLPWEAIDSVVVKPRRGLLHDGRLLVTLHHVHRAVEGLEGRARRHAVLNQKMYGAVLAVPLGLTTKVTGAETDELADRVAGLSQGRAEVVTLLDEPGPVVPADRVDEHDRVERDTDRAARPEQRPAADETVAAEGTTGDTTEDTADHTEDTTTQAAPERRMRWLRRVDHRRTVGDRDSDLERGLEDESEALPGLPAPRVFEQPLEERVERLAARVEEPPALRPAREGISLVIDALNPVDAPADPARSGKVRAIAKLGEPVAPLVIGDFQPEPAYDPVIGPELAAARTRVGLSVDELADRTRIRPHVIESIEVDDFAPCGGDFYARGHIRTLARVLGKDPAPMLAQFESRYATAPVSARRVFEAELATGLTGSMRSTTSRGPNWALLVGVVLTLVLVWSLVRLFAGDNQELMQNPPPVLNGSAGLDNGLGAGYRRTVAPPPVATTLTAANGGAHVQVRNGQGDLVFEGDLVLGESKTLRVKPPVTVTSDDGGAVTVSVAGVDQGLLGAAGQSATQVYQRPSR